MHAILIGTHDEGQIIMPSSIDNLLKNVSLYLIRIHVYNEGTQGETSKFTGCSIHIQQPAAANLYIGNATHND